MVFEMTKWDESWEQYNDVTKNNNRQIKPKCANCRNEA